ncbi:MAG: hypothetical protein ACRD6X_03015 [Pyrinomonadaceae bacterium]
MKILFAVISVAIMFYACESGANAPQNAANTGENSVNSDPKRASAVSQETETTSITPTAGPKNVRDFFMLLPEKYFTFESCERDKDKDCKRAREEYLKNFGEVVDVANGYIKGGCDGAQNCIEMAIFKRPDGTYLVGIATFGEALNDHFFLDYKDNIWTDISTKVVPEFSRKNMYELPRHGTTVKVFEKKIIEEGPDFEVSGRGKKLYDLEWKDGKFSTKR